MSTDKIATPTQEPIKVLIMRIPICQGRLKNLILLQLRTKTNKFKLQRHFYKHHI